MKVVILCGGLGVRMGEETQSVPKPLLRVGNRPILWHIMQYYAAAGHKEFILCLGYKGELIKEYFLTHDEALTSDFVLQGTGPEARVELLSSDADGWRVTFVDTGLHATTDERIKAVERFVGDDEMFLATYGDGLTDAPLQAMIDELVDRDRTAMFLSVKPQFNAHLVTLNPDGTVTGVEDMSLSGTRIDGGFFVLRRGIFDWIEPGDELVEETFGRLIPRREVVTHAHDGFFGPMDTIKDRQRLEAMYESGSPPWIDASRGAVTTPVGG